MDARSRYDVIIIGTGIAGASLAHFLAERGVTDVLLLEREDQPARHATGRSASVLVELDPDATLQGLKMLGGRFLREPPPGFAEHPLVDRRGVLLLFREPAWSAIRQVAPAIEQAGIRIELLSVQEAIVRTPVLSPAAFDGAAFLPDNGQIDVHQLLSSYLHHAKRRGVEQHCDTEVRGIRVEGGRCTGVVTGAGEIRAQWVVNAAGAWAGALGQLAAAAPITFTPYRRTIITFAAPEDLDVARWPLVQSEVHQLYFRPEADGFLLSPMDETAMAPCDPPVDELIIAEALERLAGLAPRLVPRALRRKWAGLRTFSPDRVPVVGEDPLRRGFFWLAGQGGCGIETSPAMGQIAADLIAFGKTDRFDVSALSPARFG